MTCGEFRRMVAPLTLAQVARSQDERLLSHGRECGNCGGWLEQQQRIAGAMHVLQSQTAAVEAGPATEAAVLRAFRKHVPVAPAANQTWVTPFAMRMSRWFEMGAYAATAAALIIGIAAGTWYWEQGHAGAKRAVAAVRSQPRQTADADENHPTAQVVTPGAGEARVQVAQAVRERAVHSRRARVSRSAASQTVAQAEPKQGYIDLMLCDPLICSGDEEVVRMQLPANSAGALSPSSQPLMADVVIGDDGLVRAVRIVQ